MSFGNFRMAKHVALGILYLWVDKEEHQKKIRNMK